MATKTVSNEDILELLQESMQMTAERFGHLERRFDSRFDGLEKRIDNLEAEMRKTNQRLSKIEARLDMHESDIKEILVLLGALEKRVTLTEKERELAAETLSNVVTWAQAVAKKIDVPLTVKAS